MTKTKEKKTPSVFSRKQKQLIINGCELLDNKSQLSSDWNRIIKPELVLLFEDFSTKNISTCSGLSLIKNKTYYQYNQYNQYNSLKIFAVPPCCFCLSFTSSTSTFRWEMGNGKPFAAADPAPDALAFSYTSELLSSGGKWENHEIFGTRYQLPVSSSSVDLRSRGLARDVGTRLVSLPTPGPRTRAPIPSASKTNQIIYLTSALICLLSFVKDVLCSNLCCPPAQQVLQLSH